VVLVLSMEGITHRPRHEWASRRHDLQVADYWSSRHFSLTNPRDDGSTDLPRLLRRLADHIEDLGIQPMDVLDVTIAQDITEDGPWWSATVYWSPDAEADDVSDEASR